MLFSNGLLMKTNINFQDNEFEYYRLIGHAYNTRKLDRQSINETEVQHLYSSDDAQLQSK